MIKKPTPIALTPETLRIGLAQIAPVWLDRERTLSKILSYIERSADQECQLVAFGEAILPGYPFWIERTDGARFNSQIQKEIHAHYMQQAVQIKAGHLKPLQEIAARRGIWVIVGFIEWPSDRGGHSLYCSLVIIDAKGGVRSVHRKLMPTYEERLTWAIGDGHGLRVHKLGAFTVGGLNCWENWMPLPRAALYALGEDLHIALWPGALRNTVDITRFISMEARSFVLSVSGLMRVSDFPDTTPHLDLILAGCRATGGRSGSEADLPQRRDLLLADGGSCIAGPDGQWVVEPVVGEETLLTATLDHRRVREERQNFDPAGHYGRPDVTQLTVNRTRQSTVFFVD